MANYSNIFVKDGLSYTAYRELIASLLQNGKTTGDDHSEAMLHYTMMNLQRMNRVEKTAVLSDALTAAIVNLKKHYHLLVISEGWCGDAAQIVPLFEKMTALRPEKFDLRFVLRDQHLPLIDAYLTHGGRAIPVLLVMDDAGEVILKWGPRPVAAQELLNNLKAEVTDKFELAERLHLWYAKDKTHSTQTELLHLVEGLE